MLAPLLSPLQRSVHYQYNCHSTDFDLYKKYATAVYNTAIFSIHSQPLQHFINCSKCHYFLKDTTTSNAQSGSYIGGTTRLAKSHENAAKTLLWNTLANKILLEDTDDLSAHEISFLLAHRQVVRAFNDIGFAQKSASEAQGPFLQKN